MQMRSRQEWILDYDRRFASGANADHRKLDAA
jgi:hypothetical protein